MSFCATANQQDAALTHDAGVEVTDEVCKAVGDSIRKSLTSLSPDAKRIVILTCGTRGDVQPFMALGTGLQTAGFRVLIVTNVNHQSFLQKFGLEAKGILDDTESWLAGPLIRKFQETSDFKVLKEMGSDPTRKQEGSARFAKDISNEYDVVREFAPDLLIEAESPLPTQEMNGVILSRLLKIPRISAALQPCKPTKYYKTVFNENAFSYQAWILLLKNQYSHMVKDVLPIIYSKFEKQLDGDKIYKSWDDFYSDTMSPIAPELLGVSSAIFPRPKDWPKSLDPVNFTGFWVIGQEEQMKQAEAGGRRDSKFGGQALTALEQFLAAGSEPVYMGWGSMTPGEPANIACLAVRSLKKAGLRGIILGGWAKLKADMVKGQPDEQQLEEYIRNSILFVDTAPHEWLFPQCSVLVHHGGAGTMGAGLRSGRPSVITPCIIDQFGNADLVHKAGCGIATKQFSRVTVDSLSVAILKCSEDVGIKKRCKEMRETLLREDSIGNAVKAINGFVEGDLASGLWRSKLDEQIRLAKLPRPEKKSCFCCARRSSQKVHAVDTKETA